jgi:hypothetical protein
VQSVAFGDSEGLFGLVSSRILLSTTNAAELQRAEQAGLSFMISEKLAVND